MILTTGGCAWINWASMWKKCGRRKKTIPPSRSSWRWRWIICRAMRIGSSDLAGRYPWDYFIGSVHYVSDNWAVDNPEQLSRWKDADPFEVWSLYFERLTRAAESGLFEIIGHADLPKKFNIRPRQDCAPLYRRFLRCCQDQKYRHRTQHRRPAQGLPRNLPQPRLARTGRAGEGCHHFRLRRPRAGRSGPRLRAGGGAGALGWLHPLSPFRPAPPQRGAEDNQCGKNALDGRMLFHVPVGESPTGTGGSPVPPPNSATGMKYPG
jgi:hypothetical protein